MATLKDYENLVKKIKGVPKSKKDERQELKEQKCDMLEKIRSQAKDRNANRDLKFKLDEINNTV